MRYEKKFNEKKEKLILELRNAFEISKNSLKKNNLSIDSIGFQNGRNDNDFVIVKLLHKEQTSIEVIFWITFWIGFEFNKNDFTIIIKLHRREGDSLEKNIKYSEIKGTNLNDKICNLIEYVSIL